MSWTVRNAALMISTTAAALAVPRLTLLPALTGAASLGWLWLQESKLRAPDVVTAFRGVAALFFFVLAYTGTAGTVVLLVILVAAECLDFLDGFLARKTGGSEFGGRWDMETDAYFILLLSLAAYRFAALTPVVVAAGLFRYVFVFVFLAVKPVQVTHQVLGFFMKAGCVGAVLALIIANQPWLPLLLQVIGAWFAAVILAVSFGWETVYYIRHGANTT